MIDVLVQVALIPKEMKQPLAATIAAEPGKTGIILLHFQVFIKLDVCLWDYLVIMMAYQNTDFVV